VITIPKYTGALFDDAPGPWWMHRRTALRGVEIVSAYVKCPHGHIAAIETHTIAADGTVTPSVVCTGEEGRTAKKSECDWHENIKLEGW